MTKRPLLPDQLRRLPRQFSWVDQRLVRDHRIDHLSHAACALYLFLVTVADAQGLSYYADRSVCQHLSMSQALLGQARQLLVEQGLLAYQPPLYQVLNLGKPKRMAPEPRESEDEPVDLKTVFKHIWEVLS